MLKLLQCLSMLIGLLMELSVLLKIRAHALLLMHFLLLVLLKEFQLFFTKINNSTQFNKLLIVLKATETMAAVQELWSIRSIMQLQRALIHGLLTPMLVECRHVNLKLDFSKLKDILL